MEFASDLQLLSLNEQPIPVNRSQLYTSTETRNNRMLWLYLLGCGSWYSTFSGFGTIAPIYMFKSQLNTHKPTKIVSTLLWMELLQDVFMTDSYELWFSGFPLRELFIRTNAEFARNSWFVVIKMSVLFSERTHISIHYRLALPCYKSWVLKCYSSMAGNGKRCSGGSFNALMKLCISVLDSVSPLLMRVIRCFTLVYVLSRNISVTWAPA